jgi:hypothetical protein
MRLPGELISSPFLSPWPWFVKIKSLRRFTKLPSSCNLCFTEPAFTIDNIN